MVAYYHIYNDFCKPRCIKGNLDQFVVDHLCESIDNDYNGIVTVSLPID